MNDMPINPQDMMTGAEKDAFIRTQQNAVVERMKSDLDAARSTLVASGTIKEGLACHVEQGKFRTTLDMGTGMGGEASGPPPGFFARAAIVGCVAIAVKMLAAREGLRFEQVDVTVEMDFDDAALMFLTESSAAPLNTRVNIAIKSDEPEELVSDLVDRALSRDPWYLALRDAQLVTPSLVVSPQLIGQQEGGC